MSPAYHRSSPLLTTTVDRSRSMRTTFERLSNVSCPLIASTDVLGSVLEHDRHAVAADEPAAFVGDRERRGAASRAARGRATVKLSSCSHSDLLGAEVAQAARLQVLAGDLADLHQESQVAALRVGPGAGALEDFDQAVDAAIGADRREHQQELGRVGRGFARRRPCRRRSAGPPAPARRAWRCCPSNRPCWFIASGLSSRPVCWRLTWYSSLKPVPLFERPHDAADGGQRGDRFLEQRRVELAWARPRSSRGRRLPGRATESPAWRGESPPRRDPARRWSMHRSLGRKPGWT